MRLQTLHLLLVLFGFSHTLLCVRGQQLSEDGTMAPTAVLSLEWQWTFRDVVAVANIAQLGALFSNCAARGNEVGMLSSFSAGIALRVVLNEVVPADAAPFVMVNPFVLQKWVLNGYSSTRVSV